MKSAILVSLIASAVAFAPAKEASRTPVATNAAIDDLKTIAEKSNPVLKVCSSYLCTGNPFITIRRIMNATHALHIFSPYLVLRSS